MNRDFYRHLYDEHYSPDEPGRLLRSWLHRAKTRLTPLGDISEQQTKIITTAPPRSVVTESLPKITQSFSSIPSNLYLDSKKRLCLHLIDLERNTIDLVRDAVYRFVRLAEFYPEEIVLCASRFARIHFDFFYPVVSPPIPYLYDPELPVMFDVLVRR